MERPVLPFDPHPGEKSADGISFQPVTATASRYGGSSKRLYRTPDPAPQEGIWQYRLKVAYHDGSVAHTPPQLVRLELPVDFTVFPNPAGSEVRVALAGQAGKPALLQLINAQGVIVATQRFDELPTTPVVFGIRHLPDGFYLVNVQVEGRRSRAVRLVVAKE